jgi:hypothetical protein
MGDIIRTQRTDINSDHQIPKSVGTEIINNAEIGDGRNEDDRDNEEYRLGDRLKNSEDVDESEDEVIPASDIELDDDDDDDDDDESSEECITPIGSKKEEEEEEEENAELETRNGTGEINEDKERCASIALSTGEQFKLSALVGGHFYSTHSKPLSQNPKTIYAREHLKSLSLNPMSIAGREWLERRENGIEKKTCVAKNLKGLPCKFSALVGGHFCGKHSRPLSLNLMSIAGREWLERRENGIEKKTCVAKNLKGLPCKFSALVGGHFCGKHSKPLSQKPKRKRRENGRFCKERIKRKHEETQQPSAVLLPNETETAQIKKERKTKLFENRDNKKAHVEFALNELGEYIENLGGDFDEESWQIKVKYRPLSSPSILSKNHDITYIYESDETFRSKNEVARFLGLL